MYRYATLLAFGVFAAGCSTYQPLPVGKPVLDDYNKYADTSATAIPVPKEISDSMKFAWTYGEFYRAKKDDIHTRIYNHSDASLFGTLFAMLGGAAKSPEAVLGGGIFAAGAEIAPGRYQLSVQATNYEKAEKAAMCVFDELRKIGSDDAAALATYEEVIGRSAERTVGDLTYRTFKIVHARLDTAQANVSLISPNLDKLQGALAKNNEEQAASATTTDAAKALVAKNNPLALNARSFADVPVGDIQKRAEKGDILFKQLSNKFEVCLELVGAGQ
jgi:hypothetical protein